MSPELDAIVLRCLEKKKELRFASVAELLKALQAAVQHSPAPELHAAPQRCAVGLRPRPASCGNTNHIQ